MTQPNAQRILIADDHEMILDMLTLYLSKAAAIDVSTARTLPEAQGAIAAAIEAGTPFDLVILDLTMAGMNGLEGLRATLAGSGGRPVAIMTGSSVHRLVDDIIHAGAAGILLKSSPARSLVNAIRFMLAGEQYLPIELVRMGSKPMAEGGDGPLSSAETAVMGELAKGMQNKEISKVLNMAEATVKMHVTAICRKLGARNRTQAVVNARTMGLA